MRTSMNVSRQRSVSGLLVCVVAAGLLACLSAGCEPQEVGVVPLQTLSPTCTLQRNVIFVRVPGADGNQVGACWQDMAYLAAVRPGRRPTRSARR